MSAVSVLRSALERGQTEPGELVEFTARRHPEGASLWLERIDPEGAPSRQRHYLRVPKGPIERHWIYAAPPRTAPPGSMTRGAVPGDAVPAELGEVVGSSP